MGGCGGGGGGGGGVCVVCVCVNETTISPLQVVEDEPPAKKRRPRRGRPSFFNKASRSSAPRAYQPRKTLHHTSAAAARKKAAHQDSSTTSSGKQLTFPRVTQARRNAVPSRNANLLDVAPSNRLSHLLSPPLCYSLSKIMLLSNIMYRRKSLIFSDPHPI